ncbi:MAG: hypothetical protein GY859_05455 [Desulfobacterales bacterium]|nr:hypothetical protein [Desulfobacterales bacterium]
MLIHDNIFAWEGFGGALRLGSGNCRLRIYDRNKGGGRAVAHMKPFIVIVSDTPGDGMSVRSCAGHVATNVTRAFDIDPNRMIWIEHYPRVAYGVKKEHVIPERYEVVDFTWRDGKALEPKWKTLQPPMLDIILAVIEKG